MQGWEVDLPDSGGDRRKEQQALVRVVLDDLSDEPETVALDDGIRTLGAGEAQVNHVHIFELEGGPNRRFGTLVPGRDQDVA